MTDRQRLAPEERLGPQIVETYSPTASEIVEAASTEFPLTDLGNAERFAREHQHRLRYCHARRSWYFWDGKRWAPDDTGTVQRRATETIRGIGEEAANCADKQNRKELQAHARKSEQKARIDAMIDLAKSQEALVVRPEELDFDPWALNVENGTVDLRTGELHPHDPDRLQTRLAPVEFRPDATAPTFEKFLQRIFGDDKDLIAYVQRAVGYSLTGQTDEQCLFICWGAGANGKSTLISVLQDLGGDYARTTPAESLLVKSYGDSATHDLARLEGVRLVATSEMDEGRRLSEARVKSLTGGDRIAARRLYQEAFEYRPHFKLWMATNHRPEIRGTDEGMWRRVHLLPFNVSIPPEERDPQLLDKLRGELSGILNWAVAGCLEWQNMRLRPPEAVLAATDTYRNESDPIGRFLDDKCLVGEGFEVQAAALYHEYKMWCEKYGETPRTHAKFGLDVKGRGHHSARNAKGVRYVDIGLKSDQ